MYIFKFPAKVYEMKLTFAGISEFIDKGHSANTRMLGTTVELARPARDKVRVQLYGTTIASLWDDGEVLIHERINQYGSQATTAWVQRILSDNNIGGLVARVDGRYAVAGQTFNIAD
jgi:hypothetical protein